VRGLTTKFTKAAKLGWGLGGGRGTPAGLMMLRGLFFGGVDELGGSDDVYVERVPKP